MESHCQPKMTCIKERMQNEKNMHHFKVHSLNFEQVSQVKGLYNMSAVRKTSYHQKDLDLPLEMENHDSVAS